VLDNARALLRPGGTLAIVMGDMYARSETVPLTFYCTMAAMARGFQLKAINIKDIQGNEKGKGRTGNLWRYRALKMGFSVFKWEAVSVFVRRPDPKRGTDKDSARALRTLANALPAQPRAALLDATPR
jgi:hypothetical protein